jgi:hypothetical protein
MSIGWQALTCHHHKVCTPASVEALAFPFPFPLSDIRGDCSAYSLAPQLRFDLYEGRRILRGRRNDLCNQAVADASKPKISAPTEALSRAAPLRKQATVISMAAPRAPVSRAFLRISGSMIDVGGKQRSYT